MDKSPIDTFFLFDSFFIKKNKDIFLERLDKLIRINNQFLPKNRHNLISNKSFQSLNADDEQSASLTMFGVHPITEIETDRIEQEENEISRTIAYARYYSRSGGGRTVIIFTSSKKEYESKIGEDSFIKIIDDPVIFNNQVTSEYQKTIN